MGYNLSLERLISKLKHALGNCALQGVHLSDGMLTLQLAQVQNIPILEKNHGLYVSG